VECQHRRLKVAITSYACAERIGSGRKLLLLKRTGKLLLLQTGLLPLLGAIQLLAGRKREVEP
jgi:hypothetical protein